MAHLHSASCCSRRQFLSHCAACAGGACGAALLTGNLAHAAQQPAKKPRIRLVFCETPNDGPIWPNVGYDFQSRRELLQKKLAAGCPDLEFVSSILMNDPAESAELVAKDADTDGYVVLLQGLGWRNDATKLSTTGKPTLVTDNLFGGSGLFLGTLPKIMASGKPVDWVSSSRDDDLVASVACFRLLAEGHAAADVVSAARSARRRRTPGDLDMACAADPVETADFEEALAELRQTKLLVVVGGRGGDAFAKAARDVTGLELVPIEFEELAAAYEAADRTLARQFADRWADSAEKVVEPSREDLEKSGMMSVAMDNLIKRHGARGISVNCLGGFYGGHLKAYPCLGFSQLNNDGFVGGCEADQRSALTMAVLGALFHRPGFISDPVIDTSKNQIIYAHCVAMTRPFGTGGTVNPYRIRSHSEDRKGAAIQSILPAGYMTTTLELDPTDRTMIVHRAKTVGNNPSDLACRTKLEAVVQGDLEKLTETWRGGWHRVTVYGDVKEPLAELCERLGVKMIEEA